MRPTLAAEELKRNLTQYLTTTFALADQPAREGLERFLNDPRQGMFRGPYLRIRTPFTHAGADWRQILEWAPDHPVPYLHQVQAWQPPEQQGPGSRADADHHRDRVRQDRGVPDPGARPLPPRARGGEAGRQGGPAVPDERARHRPGEPDQRPAERPATCRGVTAGLYIGERPDTTYARVLTERSDIRRQPPDILITNYKMLDLLLQRGDDLPLWRDADIRYVVVDEFHTYDGAQGTDVAMLLRRLAAATGHAEPGRPLGRICPVATSATLGETAGNTEADPRGRRGGLRHPVRPGLGDRRAAAGAGGLPRPGRLRRCRCPTRRTSPPSPTRGSTRPRWSGSPQAVTGQSRPSPGGAGPGAAPAHPHPRADRGARRQAVDARPRSSRTCRARVPTAGARPSGSHRRRRPPRSPGSPRCCRSRRDPDGAAPFLHVETHLWIRPLSRIVRLVSDAARVRLARRGRCPRPSPRSAARRASRCPPSTAGTAAAPAGPPSRRNETRPSLVGDPHKIYRAAVSDKRLVRAVHRGHRAGGRRVRGRPAAAPPTVLVLEPDGRRVRPLNPARDTGTDGGRRRRPDGVFVLGDLRHDREGEPAAERDRCPACEMDEGTRFLGAGLASLASVAITELFTGGQLDDPTQDAAVQRLGAGRRAPRRVRRQPLVLLLAAHAARRRARQPPGPAGLAERPHRRRDHERVRPAAGCPPSSRRTCRAAPTWTRCWPATSQGDADTWRLISERLAFQVVLEFGLRSRQGRTLELTRTAAAEVVLDDPDADRRPRQGPDDRRARTPRSTGLPPRRRTSPPASAASWNGSG